MTKDMYERLRPLIIWLGLIELGWISFWLLSNEKSIAYYTLAVWLWIVILLAWMIFASYLGKRGYYLRNTYYFSNLAGFASVLIFTALVFGFSPSVREGIILASKQVTDIQFVGIHVLRLTAIGTIIKYLQGELPRHFFLLGSMTDFLFAISAVAVTLLTINGQLGHYFLIAWHLLGSIVFLGAGVSMFFSVPSLFQMTDRKPDSKIVFQYPMMLAPNFTVPLFVVAHCLALIKLFYI